ncbi:hypothetical protein KIH27_01060 [Mycobacterium sp. M1]|uniref:Uncharacterized protein n=1 Tax=Mycolicibacter acidiphilus TaxID=2835306 RepID=A0ABS5RD09_9MYCO|nr:hypothetical protein [Mycolicibacter acidiphilus]MBS9532172.1 hypothetical protein [Mycolicibacter acidiphilus]
MQTTGNNDGPEMVAVVSGFALIPIIASVSTIACAFTDATRQWFLAAPPTPPPPQTNPWYPPHPG